MPAEAFADSRWRQLSDVITGYSVAVARNQHVLISMLEPDTYPLVRALCASVIRAGGYPQVEFGASALEKDLLRLGTEEQVAWVPELTRLGMEWADVYIGVRGAANPFVLEGVAPDRIALHRKAIGRLSALRTAKTRWVLVRVPSDAMAQQAGMDVDEIMDLFFRAVLKDWTKEAEEYGRINALFEGGSEIRVTGNGTDLRFSTIGRRFLVEDGRINMPGGELYTSPRESSAEGTIRFSFPGSFAGQTVTGITLGFVNGKVVSAHAEQNEALLHRLLAMDEGASRVGEFGVGLNRTLDRPVGDPLFDEKIHGTVHLALGRSYAACGGLNDSALHWDLVTDLREKGEITVDGRQVFNAGRFNP
jgi:aminopeptidase